MGTGASEFWGNRPKRARGARKSHGGRKNDIKTDASYLSITTRDRGGNDPGPGEQERRPQESGDEKGTENRERGVAQIRNNRGEAGREPISQMPGGCTRADAIGRHSEHAGNFLSSDHARKLYRQAHTAWTVTDGIGIT